MISEETYKMLDIAKQYISSLELRPIEGKCFVYIEGKEEDWVSGSNASMDAYIRGYLSGIVKVYTRNSLKKL
jgi:hypothetical protein